MWSKIKTIVKPAGIDEALQQSWARNKVCINGGTYLIAEKPPRINTLIDISGLIDKKILIRKREIQIGAGATLQDLVVFQHALVPDLLPACARWSCPSRNIRNQRTLGGELARARPDSELYAYFSALEVELEVCIPGPVSIPLKEWDGGGIISLISIDTTSLTASAVERCAVLPSAPAFIIVAGVRRENTVTLALGGKLRKQLQISLPRDEFTEAWIRSFCMDNKNIYPPDHLGSEKTKQQILRTGLRRVRSRL